MAAVTLGAAPIVAIHEPNVLPWLGHFNKLLGSDVFVLFDDVQAPGTKTVVGAKDPRPVPTRATVYMNGETVGSQRHIDEEWFRQEGIQLEWQQFQHPRYRQLYGEFAEYLSVIDLLFNCGPEARSILLSS